MVTITNNSVNDIHNINEYCADTEQDLNDPVLKSAGFGSSVYVIETSTVYMKNSTGSWVKQ